MKKFILLFSFIFFFSSSISYAANGSAHGTGFVPAYVYASVHDFYAYNLRALGTSISTSGSPSLPLSDFHLYFIDSTVRYPVLCQDSLDGDSYSIKQLRIVFDDDNNFYYIDNYFNSSTGIVYFNLWKFDASYIFGQYSDSGSFIKSSQLNWSSSIDMELYIDFPDFPQFPDIMSYPPMFPTNTGLSYSSVFEDYYIENISYSSQGVSLPSGYAYAICPVEFTVKFNDNVSFNRGSYVFHMTSGGSGTANGTFPTSAFVDNLSYITSVSRSSFFTIDAVNFTNSASISVYFTLTNNRSSPSFTFTMYFFTLVNVPSFNYTYSNTLKNRILVSDSNLLLSTLQSLNNSFVSADGANDGLNNQNKKLASSMADYQKDTDTSTQYNNISDSIFVLDKSIFNSVSSTITLFSSCITSFFNSLGDLATPLTLFLIVTLISCIIGIIKITNDSS